MRDSTLMKNHISNTVWQSEEMLYKKRKWWYHFRLSPATQCNYCSCPGSDLSVCKPVLKEDQILSNLCDSSLLSVYLFFATNGNKCFKSALKLWQSCCFNDTETNASEMS